MYLKWRQSRYWDRPECFQTAPISSMSPKLSNDASYMDVPHQDPTHSTYWFLEQHELHQTPKNHVPNQKTTKFHRSSRLRPAPRHQSVHRDPIHHGIGRAGAAGLTEAHVGSNPGKVGRQDWGPRPIHHAKHAPCGRLRRPT